MTRLAIAVGFLLLASIAAASELDTIKAETNLEKRSDKALEYADGQFEAATQAYSAGDFKKSMSALDDTLAGVELSYDSLRATGKSPRRSPKYFKHAELRTRELLRRLRDFSDAVSFEDRPAVDKVVKRIQQIHDDLIESIMTKKRK